MNCIRFRTIHHAIQFLVWLSFCHLEFCLHPWYLSRKILRRNVDALDSAVNRLTRLPWCWPGQFIHYIAIIWRYTFKAYWWFCSENRLVQPTKTERNVLPFCSWKSQYFLTLLWITDLYSKFIEYALVFFLAIGAYWIRLVLGWIWLPKII